MLLVGRYETSERLDREHENVPFPRSAILTVMRSLPSYILEEESDWWSTDMTELEMPETDSDLPS